MPTNPLIAAQRRLYLLPGESEQTLEHLDLEGKRRLMLIHFLRPRDWPQVAKLYQSVQDELDLPAPALSVDGDQGYLLWFSLAEAVPQAIAENFLKRLQQHYLAEIPAHYLRLHPLAGDSAEMPLTPAPHPRSGKWSAYIDPDLGSVFIEECGLEMAPSGNQQADLLARLKSIEPEAFVRACEQLPQAGTETAKPAALRDAESHPPPTADPPTPPGLDDHYSDPTRFLLAVMNNPAASTGQRIKAAKALLPYFSRNE